MYSLLLDVHEDESGELDDGDDKRTEGDRAQVVPTSTEKSEVVIHVVIVVFSGELDPLVSDGLFPLSESDSDSDTDS